VNVLDYLNSKGLQLKQAGPNNVHTSCFFCKEELSKRGRLYINVDPNMSPPGLFDCKLCGETGAINKLRKHFRDPALDDDGNEFAKPGTKTVSVANLSLLRVAAEYYQDQLLEDDKTMEWLKTDRGLTPETIGNHRLGWADGKLAAHLKSKGFTQADLAASNLINKDGSDFFVNRVTIPYIINGHVVQIRGKDKNAKYFTPPGDPVRPYNIDSVRDAKKVIITEGEFDAMVVGQLGYATIGLPGATAWQDSWNGYLSDAKKIFVCMDRDESGAKGYEKIAKSLGSRVKQVLMPPHMEGEKKNDPTEWLVVKRHTAEEFADLVDEADDTMLVSVLEAQQEWEQMEGNPLRERTSTGLVNLDRYIDGGIQNGQVVVILAKTGTGKTQILINMFHNIIQKDKSKKILFFSLEQTSNEWFDRALKIYSFHNPPKPKTLEELKFWRDHIDDKDSSGRLKYFLHAEKRREMVKFYQDNLMIVDKNRITEDDMRLCVEEFVEQMGQKPDIVAVDYLGYWARAFKGEGYERTTAAVMKLKEIAKDLQIPIISPHQVNRNSNSQRLDLASARDAGAVEETADFLLALQSMTTPQADERSTGMVDVDTNQILISILKSRHGGKGHDVTLVRAPQSLVMVESSMDAGKVALANHQWKANKADENLNEFHLRVAANHFGVFQPMGFRPQQWKIEAFDKLEQQINESQRS